MKTKIIIMSLILFFTGLTKKLYSQTFTEVLKAVASDRTEGDQFGQSVSISNNIAIIGANLEDYDVNGGNYLSAAGAAYIFERDINGNWVEIQKLVASDRTPLDLFGHSVSISGDYAIIGAYQDDEDSNGTNPINNAGSAYIFKRNSSGVWYELQKIVASDRGEVDLFGGFVSISEEILVVGANREDEDESGSNTLDSAGSAYVFEFNESDGLWFEVQKLVASDRSEDDWFGASVSIYEFTIVISAYTDSHDENGGDFAYRAGSAYVFQRDNNGVWIEEQKIVASDRAEQDNFGYSLSVFENFIVVGAPGEDEDIYGNNYLSAAGSAYIFQRDGNGVWNEEQKIVASDRKMSSLFGTSTSITNEYTLIGAIGETEDVNGNNPFNYSGASYVFKYNPSNSIWIELQKIVASDRGVGDRFGHSVSINGCDIFVGSYFEDEDSNGNNTMNNSGSAYIFDCGVLGIEDYKTISIPLYPNPTKGNTFITLDTNATYTLVNIHGQALQNGKLNSGENEINLSRLSSGLYFINIKTNTGSKTLKIIKQ